MNDRAKILVIDNHPEMRSVLCQVLRKDPRCEVIGEGADCATGAMMAREHTPDIAIIDCNPPLKDEQHYALQIRSLVPSIYIAMFTLQQNKRAIASALKAGCKAYFSKSEGPDIWTEALNHALRNEPFFSGDANEFLVGRILDESVIPLRRLSPRQHQVVQQIAEGRKNSEVADVLGMSVKTVESHRLKAMQRLELKNTAELVRYAIRTLIIDP